VYLRADVKWISGGSVSSGAAAMRMTWRSRITIEERVIAKKRDIPPIHPGEVLLEKFLVPMDISQYRLAKDISVRQRRISEIVQGK
jgi:hypothetical protein